MERVPKRQPLVNKAPCLTYTGPPELSLSYLKLEQGGLCVPLKLSETKRTPSLLKTVEGSPVSFLLSPGQW